MDVKHDTVQDSNRSVTNRTYMSNNEGRTYRSNNNYYAEDVTSTKDSIKKVQNQTTLKESLKEISISSDLNICSHKKSTFANVNIDTIEKKKLSSD